MSESKRLHPVFMLFPLYSGITTILPILVVTLFRKVNWLDLHWSWYVSVPLVIGMFIGWGWLKWKKFVYVLEDDRLVIRKGVLVHEEKSIYFARIHSVNTEQPILQRILRVVQVKIETPGGKTIADGILPAVSNAEAQRLQRWIRERTDGKVESAAEETIEQGEGPSESDGTPASEAASSPLLKLTPAKLALAALTTMNIGLVLTFVGGVYTLADDFLPDHIYEKIFKDAWASLPGGWAIAFLIFIGLLFAWCLSVLLFVIKYGGFTVSQEGEQIAVTYGLLEKKHHLFSPNRVQTVIIKEGLLRQILGYGQVEICVIATGKDEKLMLHPLIHMREIPGLLADIVPQFTMEPVQSRPPKRALFYYVRLGLFLTLLMSGGLIWYFHAPGLWSLLLIPLCFFWDIQRFRDSGMTLMGKQLTLRKRILARITYYARRPQIVAVNENGTVFQRRQGLLSLKIHLMGNVAGAAYSVSCLEKKDVEQVWNWFSRKKSGKKSLHELR